jgi:hypothetical protein
MSVFKNTHSFYTLIVYLSAALFLSGCGGGGGSDPVTPVVSLRTLDINTIEADLKISETFQLSVIGTYSDSSTRDLTSLVTWSVADTTTLGVSNTGLLTAISAGIISVTASLEGVSESVQIKVLPALNSLSITDISSTFKVEKIFQLTATGTYSDGTSQNLTSLVTWSVSDSAIIEVSNTGLLTTISSGTSNVLAVFEGQSIERSVTVKTLIDLSISPTSVTLAIASSQQLNVVGRYTDNSTENLDNSVVWGSSKIDVASISNTGEVLSISPGTVSILATVAAISTSLNVTVSPATLKAITIFSPVTQIASGLTTTFEATGVYSDGTKQDLSSQVVWTVSDSSIASINSETGLLTALQVGTSSVIATKEGQTSFLNIAVSPASLTGIAINPSGISLAKGSNKSVNVTAHFSDNTKQDVSNQVDWVNTNDQVAVIEDNSFTVQSLSAGSTTISARILSEQADLSIIVTDAELVSLSLSPINISIPLGQSQQYYVTGTFSDGTIQDLTSEVTWLSSSEEQALISNAKSSAGLAESITVGSTTLTAVLGNIQQDTLLNIENTELSSIEIQPANQVIVNGTNANIKALGYFKNGSVIDLTSKVIWSSSNSNFVGVLSANDGTVQSLNKGSVLISATLEGISGLGNITITDVTLQSIAISAPKKTMASGITQQLVATGTYSDMSTTNISQQVNWQSDDVLKATISNNDESGLLSAISSGRLSISVSLGMISDQIDIDVTDATLKDIQINIPNTQINVASSQLGTAIATFSDSSTQDVSSQVNWLSSDSNVASVGNAKFDKGFVKALSPGVVNISASLQSVSSSTVPLEISLNSNSPKALNLSVQPNMILNDSNDAAQVSLVLVPTTETGVIADGTPITLTITEGTTNRDINLVTTNGAVSYSLQSSYDGFISLSATASNYSVKSGLSSTDDLVDALLTDGRASGSYENNTLKTDSVFSLPLRNLTNRIFIINQINIGYLDPNNDNTFVNFPESPITSVDIISDGDLTAGEFYFIGYELDNDVEASSYIISYLFSDAQSNTSFRLDATFNFMQ